MIWTILNDMIETWKPVPNAAHYEVSDLGRVRSLDRVVIGKNGLPYPHVGKVLTGTIATNGYPMITIVDNDGKRRNRTVHTLVAEAFLGPCPVGCEVLHGNGVRNDPAVSNLRYGTHVENCADTVLHGRSGRPALEECQRGHPYTPENVYVTVIAGRGERRQCRRCASLTSMEATRVRRGYYDRHPDAEHYI